MPKALIEVWNPANDTKLVDAYVVDGDGYQRNVDDVDSTGDKLNEAGGGRITIQEDHPAHTAAVPGNVVRLYADTAPVFAFTIAERDHVTVARMQRDRTITLDGDGLLDRWRRSVVDPWTLGRPISRDRVWNWAAPRGFDDSAWNTTNFPQTRTVSPVWPEAYPAAPIYAAQLWTREYADPQPVGSTLWRRPITFADPVDVAAFHAADDAANAWADGVLLNRHTIVWPDTSGWQKTWREVPPFDAGDHVIAYEAFNHGGPAFFTATGFEVVGGVVGDVLYSTGDGEWKWLDYPDPKPGFTCPQIIQMLLDEAQARLELLGWTITVHGDHAQIPEFSCQIGTHYLEVIDQMSAVHADFAADPEGLVLHIWPKGGRDLAPELALTATSVDKLSVIDTDDVVTAVQGVWADGVTWRERPDHPTLGRCAASLQLGSVTDEASVIQILDAYLDAHETASRSIVGEFEDVSGAVAGVDYKVGDTLPLLDFGDVRCVGITWLIGRDGNLIPHPEFDSVASVRRREHLRTVDRLTSAFDSPASAPILSSKPLLVSGHPNTGELSWSFNDLEDLENEDDPGQVKRVDTVKRLWRISIEIDPANLPDAWGTTTIELLKNGTLINVLHNVSLTTLVARAEQWMWAYEVITPADRIQVRASELGGHVDGAVTVSYCDAV